MIYATGRLKKRNIQLAHTCFDLAIEHHAAICLLYKSGLYGSMLSLLRVEFETWVYPNLANDISG